MIKKYISPSDGTIMVTVIMTILLISILSISTLTLATNHFSMVNSSTNGTKAYYLTESAIDRTIYELLMMNEAVILKFLQDLQGYKINYMNEAEESDIILLKNYNPPVLKNYINEEIKNSIEKIEVKMDQPFDVYKDIHG